MTKRERYFRKKDSAGSTKGTGMTGGKNVSGSEGEHGLGKFDVVEAVRRVRAEMFLQHEVADWGGTASGDGGNDTGFLDED